MKNNGISVNHYNTAENKLLLLHHEHRAQSWTLHWYFVPAKAQLSLRPVILLPDQATFTGLGTTWLAGRQLIENMVWEND